MPDTTALMQGLAQTLLTEAQKRIPGGPQGRAGPAITIESITADTIVLRADPPASYLIAGWPSSPMTWLTGKKVAFTPKGSGQRIVRVVSSTSLAAGHWIRPARAPDDVWGGAWQAPPTQSALSGQVLHQAASVTATTGGVTWQVGPPSSPPPFP